MWFVVVLAGLAGVIRILLPRRFAELQVERFRAAKALSRARWRSLIFVVMGLIFGLLYFLPWGHQSWIVIGTIFSLLGAAETFFQAQFPTLDALIFQKKVNVLISMETSAARNAGLPIGIGSPGSGVSLPITLCGIEAALGGTANASCPQPVTTLASVTPPAPVTLPQVTPPAAAKPAGALAFTGAPLVLELAIGLMALLAGLARE